jgi:hypothetical protein
MQPLVWPLQLTHEKCGTDDGAELLLINFEYEDGATTFVCRCYNRTFPCSICLTSSRTRCSRESWVRHPELREQAEALAAGAATRKDLERLISRLGAVPAAERRSARNSFG